MKVKLGRRLVDIQALSDGTWPNTSSQLGSGRFPGGHRRPALPPHRNPNPNPNPGAHPLLYPASQSFPHKLSLQGMAASSTPSSRRRLRPVEDIAHTPASSSRGVEGASSVGRVTRRSAAAAAAGPSASLPSGSGSGAAKRSRPSDSHQNQSQTHNDTWSNGSGPSVTEGQTAVPHKPNVCPLLPSRQPQSGRDLHCPQELY